MVYRLILALIGLTVTGCAGKHFQPFSKADYVYQAGGTLVTAADWKQTRGFEARGRVESNPILGERPSQAKINTLIPLGIACQWLTAWALPVESEFFGLKYNPRRVFQVGVIFGEGWAVHHNYNLGARFNF